MRSFLNNSLSAAERAFQLEARAFVQAALSADMAHAARHTVSVFADKELALAWQRQLWNKGWLAPGWPAEHGGADWAPMRRYLFELEAGLADAPQVNPAGLAMLGPVIMKFGTERQQAEYLPKILSGEHYWCQGYSEPGSGSDLASLRCQARREGDVYIVNGTKIWTTHAQVATHIFCLVRTDASEKKQKGISFLLIDMATPGIVVRPIISLSGDHDVNQVFFDDVRVPVDNLVGAEGQGWTCAKYLLEQERGGSFMSPWLLRLSERLRELAAAHGARAPLLRTLAAREMDVYCLQQLEVDLARSGPDQRSPATPSLIKTLGTELQQSLSEIALDLLGPLAARLDRSAALDAQRFPGAPADAAIFAPLYLNFRAASIYGGSNEIQRSLIARSVLSGAEQARMGYTETQTLLFDAARSFAQSEYRDEVRRGIAASASGYSAALWQQFRDLGWLGLGVPEAAGGLGGGAAEWLPLAHGLASAMPNDPLFASAALAVEVLKGIDDPERRVAATAAVAAGERRYALAVAAAGTAYAADDATVAAPYQGGYQLSGSKAGVLHAASADSILVAARLYDADRQHAEPAVFELAAGQAGVTLQHCRLMDGQLAADMVFEGVELPASALLLRGAPAQTALDNALELGAALICADSFGAMEQLVAMTAEYLNTRQQFGAPLASFQALQHRLADMHLQLSIARSALQLLLNAAQQPAPERRRILALAKTQIDKASRYIGQQAIQLHGAIGITDEFIVSALFKRLTANEHRYGDRDFHTDVYLDCGCE